MVRTLLLYPQHLDLSGLSELKGQVPRGMARVVGKPGSNKRDAKIREVQEGECGHMLNAAIP